MSGSTTNDLPLKEGAVIGAVTYLAGMVLVFVLLQLVPFGSAMTSLAPLLFASLGWMVLHGWPVLFGSSELLILVPIPILLLLFSGSALAGRTADSRVSAVKRGATIAVGYMAMSLFTIGYLYLKISDIAGGFVGLSGDVGPLVVALLVTGLVFPVVFGGLGGKFSR